MDVQNNENDHSDELSGLDLFKILADTDTDLIALHESDGTYKYVSKSFTKKLGYGISDLLGKDPYSFFHPDDVQAIKEVHAKVLIQNEDPGIEYRYRNKSGEYNWLFTNTIPVKNEAGETLFIQTRSRVIDEKKKKELLVQRSLVMTMVGAWEFDLKTQDLYWSKEVYQIYELPDKERITVEKAFSYYPEKAKNELEQAFNRAIEQGERYDISIPFISELNNYKWVRAIGEPQYEDGEIVKVSGAFQDITEIKRNEELFKDAQQMANVGGWEYYLESGELYWSDEVYRIHEVEIGTPVNINDGISFYPEGFSRDSITAAVTHALETGEGWDLELPFVTAKGNELWVRAKGRVEFMQNKPIKMLGTFQDLTEHHELLSQLKREKQFSEKIASVGPMGVYIYDFTKSLNSFVNEQYEKLLGYTIDDINAMEQTEFFGLFHPDDHEKLGEHMKYLASGKGEHAIEYRFKHKNGNWIWCYSIDSPFERNKEGEVTSFIGMFHDITERKKLEEELIKAKEEADLANRAKSQFLATMSHEIRTPMNSILGFTELLTNRITDEEQLKYLSNISSSGQLLLKLINDILDLSKIEAGAVKSLLVPVNLVRTLQEIKGVFDLSIGEKNLDFEMQISEDLPSALLLDEKHLRQIVFNIVGNAIKFTNSGSININVEAKESIHSDSRIDLEVSISDTGIGIKPEHRDSIFNAFEQQGRSISDEYGGTGLGLSISKKLVELMHGEIQIESEFGVGTTFRILIPNVAVSTITSKEENYQKNEISYTLNKSRILIADDVKNNRELLAACLIDQPVEIVMANDGQEALDKAKESNFDLVLLDIKMPKLDGVEVMKSLRAMNYKSKVVALTASVMVGYEEKVINEGFDEFLKKPISYLDLMKSLHTHLGGKINKKKDIHVAEGIPKTSGSKSISTHDLEKLVQHRFDELYVQFNLIDKEAIEMDKCEEFARMLRSAGQTIRSKWCIDLASEIDFAAKTFDTEKVLAELKKFEDIIESAIKLKGTQN
ncbi:MAG: PAS domain-containing protein [Balneolaceae bacterium]|nr:PAS domain-containing protein [Balneolaceae bacterium]